MSCSMMLRARQRCHSEAGVDQPRTVFSINISGPPSSREVSPPLPGPTRPPEEPVAPGRSQDSEAEGGAARGVKFRLLPGQAESWPETRAVRMEERREGVPFLALWEREGFKKGLSLKISNSGTSWPRNSRWRLRGRWDQAGPRSRQVPRGHPRLGRLLLLLAQTKQQTAPACRSEAREAGGSWAIWVTRAPGLTGQACSLGAILCPRNSPGRSHMSPPPA